MFFNAAAKQATLRFYGFFEQLPKKQVVAYCYIHMSPLMGDKMKRNAVTFVFLQILLDGFSYRMPMQVVDHWSHLDGFFGRVVYPICPHCGGHIEREYQRHCVLCGQALEWSEFKKLCSDDAED